MALGLARRKGPMFSIDRNRCSIPKPFTNDLISVGRSLLAIATETEKTAERFNRDKSALDDKGCYYRFNVLQGLEDIGLEDSTRKNTIIAATDRYVESQAIFKQMKACRNNLAKRQCTSNSAKSV